MNSDTYKSLMNYLDEGKKAAVVTMMKGNKGTVNTSRNKIVLTEEQLNTFNIECNMDESVLNMAKYSLATGNLQFIQNPEGMSYLIEPYFPEPRLIILGGGHIAKPLAEFGAKAGFKVTVVDDRPMFANKERFPDAEKVICESFTTCFSQLKINESAFVVIVTRGHRHDYVCLKQVLNHKTAYTGMIGSKRRVKAVKEQLSDEGYSEEAIKSVNAPIGLEIGAITPEEIAISIIAQVISYRRLTNTTAGGASETVKVNWPELDPEVIEELGNASDDPKAVVTIISTKGSVPRKAGAKMLVWPYGKTMGSIGGGCSEGEVINIARDMVRSGGIKLHDIDMTGQVAEDEGMVCGGIMKVLIEYYNG